MNASKPLPSVQCVCPHCDEEFFFLVTDRRAATICCPGCGATFPGSGDVPAESAPVERCLVCGNEEFYIQKDFNRQIGLWIVLTSFLIIFLVMLKWDHRTGIYCLFGLAAVDWIAYRLLPEVTVCYLCQSVYRRFPLHPKHRGFYLGDEEKYKKLRQDWVRRFEEGIQSGSKES
ncbi:MAG: hypothetical protein AAF517_14475 [Planctomycetota bacterium]